MGDSGSIGRGRLGAVNRYAKFYSLSDQNPIISKPFVSGGKVKSWIPIFLIEGIY